jgi:hypothetical protein
MNSIEFKIFIFLKFYLFIYTIIKINAQIIAYIRLKIWIHNCFISEFGKKNC